MAKEDFCFTYYDGDAARDMQHMTRLCRGAYHDLISMQRKTGHMTKETIEMVLSTDFAACWPALQYALDVDNQGKYYIEWVENSVNNMRINSKKASIKAKKRWEQEKSGDMLQHKKDNATASLFNTNGYAGENGYGNENGIENKEGVPGGLPLGARMEQVWGNINKGYVKKPVPDMQAIKNFANLIAADLGLAGTFGAFSPADDEKVYQQWLKVCDWYTKKGNNKSLDTLSRFKDQEIISEIKNGEYEGTQNYGGSNSGHGGYGTGSY